MHWNASAATVELLTQGVRLSTYLWRDPDGGRHFCPTCGTLMFRIGYLDRLSVNARCLQGVDIFGLEIGRFDDRILMSPG